MAASGKVVEVLCPTGRRQKVKTTPSMTVHQILQQVCEKQGYNDDEYDLKHQRKILNVTSMMRFLNLPNNAKLELVKCEKARPITMVTVAMQLEEGERYQDDFNPDTTLLDVAKKFVSDIENTGRPANHQPVCVYMRNEYKGMDKLSRTTLKNIGITTGRAAMRLVFRDIQDELNNEQPAEVKVDKNISTSNEHDESTSIEPNGKKMKLGSSPLQSTSVMAAHNNLPSVIGSSGYAASSEGNAYTPMSIIGAPPRQIFPDDDEKMMYKEEDKTIESNFTLNNNFTTNTNEFANFKFPDNIVDDSMEPVAIDPKQIRKEVRLGMPCDRKAVVFSADSGKSTKDDDGDSYEPDDQFFQVTIDDLRKRLSDLKSDKKGSEDSLLMTSSMREQKRLEKVSNFELIPVRFMLPGKMVIQGIFRPLETIGTLKEFLSEYLLSGIQSPQLFITPPKVVLKNRNETLFDAKLFPAAVVHASFNNTTGPLLKEEYLHKLSTSDEAELIVDEVLKRKHIGNNSGTHTETTNVTSAGVAMQSAASSSSASNRSTQSSSFQTNQRPKGAPKWFKTGR